MRKQKGDELASVFLVKMESRVVLHNIIGEIDSIIEMECFNGMHPAAPVPREATRVEHISCDITQLDFSVISERFISKLHCSELAAHLLAQANTFEKIADIKFTRASQKCK